MVKIPSFNKKPGAVLARRSGPFASPRSGSNSNREVTYGELEAGAEDAAADDAASAADEAADEAALASAAAEDAAAAAESAAGAAVSVLAQAASASAATRALRTSFVFIELYPEKENGKR
jgi:hypothetical protein